MFHTPSISYGPSAEAIGPLRSVRMRANKTKAPQSAVTFGRSSLLICEPGAIAFFFAFRTAEGRIEAPDSAVILRLLGAEPN